MRLKTYHLGLRRAVVHTMKKFVWSKKQVLVKVQQFNPADRGTTEAVDINRWVNELMTIREGVK